MRLSRPVELDGKLDIVPVIAGEEDALILRREAELVAIRDALPAQLVHTDHVQAQATRYLGRPWRQVLVQEKPQASGLSED